MAFFLKKIRLFSRFHIVYFLYQNKRCKEAGSYPPLLFFSIYCQILSFNPKSHIKREGQCDICEFVQFGFGLDVKVGCGSAKSLKAIFEAALWGLPRAELRSATEPSLPSCSYFNS